jgi:predicted nucleic acid-binding protein
LRLVDADVLSYALYDLSPFNPPCKALVERAARGELELYVTHTSLLEAYNVLYWTYRVRPRKAILEKMSAALTIMEVVPPSTRGLDVAREENIPLGDGILIATALENKLPVVVSNDRHVEKAASKLGLIVENPLKR